MTSPLARLALGASLTLLAAACAPDSAPPADTMPDADTATAAAPETDTTTGGNHAASGDTTPGHEPVDAAADTGGPVSEHTSIRDCTETDSRPEEAGYRASECEGPAGYAVRRIESDGRENLFVRTPTADFTSLRVSEHTGAGFGDLDDRIEWRGTREDGGFVPHALIARYEIAEDPEQPTVKTAYLLPVRLAGAAPCIIEPVGAGDDQDARARTIADDTTRRCPPR